MADLHEIEDLPSLDDLADHPQSSEDIIESASSQYLSSDDSLDDYHLHRTCEYCRYLSPVTIRYDGEFGYICDPCFYQRCPREQPSTDATLH